MLRVPVNIRAAVIGMDPTGVTSTAPLA